jgi:hypothetical protein
MAGRTLKFFILLRNRRNVLDDHGFAFFLKARVPGGRDVLASPDGAGRRLAFNRL